MKKVTLILALVAIGLFIMVPAAFGAVHSGFGLSQDGGTTEGCAACHVTHAASAAKLLAGGTDQTTFCYVCHADDATGSPYDAKNGRIWDQPYSYADPVAAGMAAWDETEYNPSYAGGFVTSYDFQEGNAYIGTVDTVIYYKANSSTHNVEGVAIGPASYSGSSAWSSVGNLPGANLGFGATKATFRCGSCHDPHSADVGTNQRLLRLNSYLSTPVVANGVNFDINATTNLPQTYNTNINAWCASCHNLLNVGAGAGHIKDGTTNKYMHAMGIVLPDAGEGSIDYSMTTGTPKTADNKLVCLSCHRAHGTAATINSNYNLNYWTRSISAGGNTTGEGSALLRLDNRDVCYNCHKAAAWNKPI